MTFCCAMREKFLVGIIAENASVATPIEAADFIDFSVKREDNRPVIRIKHCCFCGQIVKGPLRMEN